LMPVVPLQNSWWPRWCISFSLSAIIFTRQF
jgi:hypothetical protein